MVHRVKRQWRLDLSDWKAYISLVAIGMSYTEAKETVEIWKGLPW